MPRYERRRRRPSQNEITVDRDGPACKFLASRRRSATACVRPASDVRGSASCLILRDLPRALLDRDDDLGEFTAKPLVAEVGNEDRQRRLPRLQLGVGHLPIFVGFIPSSRAIWTCACERWWGRRTSIQLCRRRWNGVGVLVPAHRDALRRSAIRSSMTISSAMAQDIRRTQSSRVPGRVVRGRGPSASRSAARSNRQGTAS